jgi:SAM-dependent methyltransferase
MPEPIYERPEDYDLEHEGDTRDIAFFTRLAARVKPSRVLELACGSGRVTLPLAEEGTRSGFTVTGLELAPEMLEMAQRRREEAAPDVREALTLVEGDIRSWAAPEPFDLIVTPCSSLCHLLTLEDQIAAWRRAYDNLAPGGRFVVDVSMPDLAAYADSFTTPPREIMQIDRDKTDPETGVRLIRYRTTRYAAHEQRARIRYIYDKFAGGPAPERYVSDYESHVYFPRELELLFRLAGFEVEEVVGDYDGGPLNARSRSVIMTGRRPVATSD